MTEAEAEKEAELVEKCKYAKLQANDMINIIESAPDSAIVQTLMGRELECLKEIYKLAREIKALPRGLLLDVVKEAFNLSCQGAAYARNPVQIKAAWVREAAMFARIGLNFAKTMYGEDHSVTREWSARNVEAQSSVWRKL